MNNRVRRAGASSRRRSRAPARDERRSREQSLSLRQISPAHSATWLLTRLGQWQFWWQIQPAPRFGLATIPSRVVREFLGKLKGAGSDTRPDAEQLLARAAEIGFCWDPRKGRAIPNALKLECELNSGGASRPHAF